MKLLESIYAYVYNKGNRDNFIGFTYIPDNNDKERGKVCLFYKEGANIKVCYTKFDPEQYRLIDCDENGFRDVDKNNPKYQ